MNVDDGVVLAVIQITDDQVPNGRHLRDLHTFSSVMSHELYIQLRSRQSFISTTA